MSLVITINSVNKTSDILMDSFQITDNINNQASSCVFSTKNFKPSLNQEILVEFDSQTIFGGVIVKIETEKDRLVDTYKITCKDYSQHLNRQLVSERFINKTINEIIEYLRDEYATDFTINNVDADVSVTQVTFNRIPIAQCLDELARLVNYYWYVDYQKDIHFFAKQTEVAPFNLTNNGGNHNWDSLKITEDFSQIRNQIYVVGGEYEAEPRTEQYVADGEQQTFPLAYKYKTLTTVKIVGGPDLTVGIDGLDEEDNFDVMWSFQQKYIKFKQSNFPDADDILEVTGTPLLPVIVKVPDVSSIAEFGLYEFKIVDKNISSREDAIARGVAELEAYSESIEEGSFSTYRNGLHSGQLININVGSTNQDFILQSVNMRFRGNNLPIYQVKIATTRTLGIIQFLQRYLMKDEDIVDGETLLELLEFNDETEFTDTLGDITTREPPYLWADSVDETQEGRWNLSTWQ